MVHMKCNFFYIEKIDYCVDFILGFQVLGIINPNLGHEWKTKLFSLTFEGEESYASLEKLNIIAISAALNERKTLWLTLLEGTKSLKTMFSLPRGDHEFRM